MKEPQTNADVPSLTLGQEKRRKRKRSAVCESLWLNNKQKETSYGNKGRNSENTWRLHGRVP